MPVVSPTRRSILATSAAGASRPLHAAAVTEASTIGQFKVAFWKKRSSSSVGV